MKTASPTLSILVALTVLPTPLFGEKIKTVEGPFEEAIISILPDEDGVPILKTAARSIRLPLVRTIEFNDRNRAVSQESSIVILTNDDRLRGEIMDGDEEGLLLRTASLGVFKIALEKIRGVVLNPAMDFRKVEKYLRTKTDKDLVYLKSGSQAGGVLEKIAKQELTIDMDQAGPLNIKLEKIEMVLMSLVEAPPKPGAGTLVRLRLLDGASIQGRFLSLEKGQLNIDSLLAKKLPVRTADILELLVLNGAFLYLSDLEPTDIVQKFPESFRYYPEIFGWKKDRSVLGGLLKLGGKTYEKGLGVHSYCSLSFALDGQYTEFRAVIGLDDSVRFLGEPGMGSVRFKVLLDGKPAETIREGVLKEKGADPTHLAIKVKGVKKLTLIADYGPLLHILGRADWADAHLIRGKSKKD